MKKRSVIYRVNKRNGKQIKLSQRLGCRVAKSAPRNDELYKMHNPYSNDE